MENLFFIIHDFLICKITFFDLCSHIKYDNDDNVLNMRYMLQID